MNNKTARALRKLSDAEHERGTQEWKEYYGKLKVGYEKWRRAQ